MAFVFYNPNPKNLLVEDCVIRAISRIEGRDWDEIYLGLCIMGYEIKNLINANTVWGAYLKSLGYHKQVIPDTCPDCYTVREFCYDNPKGKYLLATGEHLVAVIDGDYYDTWDSGDEVPVYYWRKEE